MASTGQDPQKHLRLIWPEWQGAGSTSVRALMTPEFPFDVSRRGYTVGTRVLEAILPEHDGPTATVPVSLDDSGLETVDGIEARSAVFAQLDAGLNIIRDHDAERITTIGGDCGVSIAPFASLIARYGDDVAIIYIDSHPDIDTSDTDYAGYHAMVVSALTGHGDEDLVGRLPATTTGSRVALVGMHEWTNDAHASTVESWGISVFGPEQLRTSSEQLIDWLRGTSATKVAIHFDVDTIDSDEVQLGLGYDAGGLTIDQARRVVSDVSNAAEVVGFTIAEYIPRQAMKVQRLFSGFPLLG